MKTILAISTLAFAGCVGGTFAPATVAADGTDSASVSASTAVTYVDADDYTNGNGTNTQWLATKQALKDSFDWICGDTFCGSDYGQNLDPISLRCSVNGANGVLKNCAWVFSGSYETITASTGTIKVTAKTWSCHVPVSGMKLEDFIATLTATSTTQPIQRPLPGTTATAYDALLGCLP
jgi:hypothetical protein